MDIYIYIYIYVYTLKDLGEACTNAKGWNGLFCTMDLPNNYG